MTGRTVLAIGLAAAAHALALGAAWKLAVRERPSVTPIDVTPIVTVTARDTAPAPPPRIPSAASPVARHAARHHSAPALAPAPEKPSIATLSPVAAGGAAAVAAPSGANAGAAATSGAGAGRGAGAGAIAVEKPDLRPLILARIGAHKRYPELARRRGIEGTVTVSFRIALDGAVRELTVRRSADPSLDEAALAAVRDAAPLPFVDGTQAVDVDFRLVRRNIAAEPDEDSP